MRDTRCRLLGWVAPNLDGVFGRFPLSLLCVVAFTVNSLIDPVTLKIGSVPLKIFGDGTGAKIGSALSVAFLVTLGVVLFAEKRKLTTGVAFAVGLMCSFGAAIICLMADRIEARPWLLLVGLLFLLGLAPYLPMRGSNGTIWLFNYRLWVAWLMSVLAVIFFVFGAAAIVGSLNYLCGVDLSEGTFKRILILAVGFVGPVYWLSQQPRRFDEAAVEGPQIEPISQMAAAIVKYILVPLLLAYAAILHATL